MPKKKFEIDKETLVHMKALWDLGEGERSEIDPEYDRNNALYNGDTKEIWKGIVLPDNASRRDINKAFSVERAMRAKILPAIGDFKALPVEEEDQVQADICSKWFEWWKGRNMWGQLKNTLTKGGILYNDMALEVYFDPSDNFPEGSLQVKVLYPWEYVVDPLGDEWIMVEAHVPKGALKTLYPKHKKLIEDANDVDRPSRFGRKVGRTEVSKDGTKSTGGGTGSGNKLMGYVKVYKLWEKCYDWETISEQETSDAVEKEFKALIEYFYPPENTGTEEILEGAGPEEMPEHPALEFDETDNHDRHQALLAEMHREWLGGQEMGTDPAILTEMQKEIENHNRRHAATKAFMTEAGIPIGQRLTKPGGRLVVSLEFDDVLFDDENPIGRPPIVRCSMLKEDGLQWARPFFSYITPIYILRTLIVNRYYDLIKAISPKWKYMEETDLDHIDNDHTKPIKVSDPREGWDVPKLTMPQITQFIEMLDADLEELTNIYAASKGKVPEGVKSGRGLQILGEFAKTVSDLDAQTFEEPMAELGLILWTAAVKYLGPEHFKRVVGTSIDAQQMEAIDLTKLNEVTLDIKAKMKDPRMSNKESTLKYIIELLSVPAVGQLFDPRVQAEMITDQMEMSKLTEYNEKNEAYLDIISQMAAQALAQMLAEKAMEEEQGPTGPDKPSAPPIGGGGQQKPTGGQQDAKIQKEGAATEGIRPQY